MAKLTYMQRKFDERGVLVRTLPDPKPLKHSGTTVRAASSLASVEPAR